MPITSEVVRFKSGGFLFPGTLVYDGPRIFIDMPYNKGVIEEIKSMEGRHFHGFDEINPRKIWSVKNTHRNKFAIAAITEGRDPFGKWNISLIEIPNQIRFNTSLGHEVLPYPHQHETLRFIMTRHYCIVAEEMGVGKTLPAIQAMELAKERFTELYGYSPDEEEFWYVAPKSVIRSIERELRIWGSKVKPRLLTYEGLTGEMKRWEQGKKAPKFVVFDECQRIKTATSQRSQAAKALADGVRSDWGDEGFVVLMSGTPAPRAPDDWWHLCITGDTWTLTDQGPRQAKDLIGTPCNINVMGQTYQSKTGFFKTGKREVWKLATKEGYELRATPDHKILTLNGWVELQNLKIGDQVRLGGSSLKKWEGRGTNSDGYLIGLVIGDGTVNTKPDGHTYGTIQCCHPDFDLIPIIMKNKGLSASHSEKVTRINGSLLNQLVREWRIDRYKEISPLIESGSSSFLRGLLSGLFDSDGTVEKSRLRIMFAQTDWSRIAAVQRILGYFGIRSEIRIRKNNHSEIAGREVKTQDSYRLFIVGDDAEKFYVEIGFNHPRKQNILRERIQARHTIRPSNAFVTVKAILPDCVEDVYDITVDGVHAFSANGMVVHNCEVARPGFLKEGDIYKFRERLGVIVKRENKITGGAYPQLITWRDDEKKCKTCGNFKEHINHEANAAVLGAEDAHPYVPGTNEVLTLYKRLVGLVLIKFKKDCTNLPDKIYRVIRITPDKATLRAAKLLVKSSRTVIEGLTRLRELSDGFQYDEVASDEMRECTTCYGKKEIADFVEIEGSCPQCGDTGLACLNHTPQYNEVKSICPGCHGRGEQAKIIRIAKRIECPKDNVLSDLLDENEELGRIVVYGGFQESVDRSIDVCHNNGWCVIQADGRGWKATYSDGTPIDTKDYLGLFQDQLGTFSKVAFVGHPASAGMGSTLTKACMEVYVSNDHNGEARTQSEDRIHRHGMDLNRGATIVDIIHLPSDEKVLNSLKAKRDLEKLSMGELSEALLEERAA